MAKIFGDIGRVLSNILETPKGVSVNELRDTEGVHLTYDLGGVAEADLFSMDTRGFDTGNLAASASSTQSITGLPPVYMFMGVSVCTDQVTRISQVWVFGSNVGVAGSTRDFPLWVWNNGDDSIYKDPGINVGDASLTSFLVPSTAQGYFDPGLPLADRLSVKSRQGPEQLSVLTTTTAFGAGTARVTGHITIGFFRRGQFLVAARPF